MNNYLEETIMLEESLNNILIEEESNNRSNKLNNFVINMKNWFIMAKNKISDFIKSIVSKVKSFLYNSLKNKSTTSNNVNEVEKITVQIPSDVNCLHNIGAVILKMAGLETSDENLSEKLKDLNNEVNSNFDKAKEMKETTLSGNSGITYIRNCMSKLDNCIKSVEKNSKYTLELMNDYLNGVNNLEKICKNLNMDESDREEKIKNLRTEIKNGSEIVSMVNSINTRVLSVVNERIKIYNNIMNKFSKNSK